MQLVIQKKLQEKEVRIVLVERGEHIVLSELKAEYLNGIYKDIAENLGVEIARLFYIHYKGLQVTFPVRFLSKEYIQDQIFKEYNGSNTRTLARKYEYSERWIREIVNKVEYNR